MTLRRFGSVLAAAVDLGWLVAALAVAWCA